MDKEVNMKKRTTGRIRNPYYTKAKPWYDKYHGYLHRMDLVIEYSWAIPTQEAIESILVHANKFVEMGCGTGYWARLITRLGGNVIAYDFENDQNEYHHKSTFFEVNYVKKGEYDHILKHGDRALLLCWPPNADVMAFEYLKRYTGDTVIYIGEGYGGCAGDDAFHELLDLRYILIETISIPQWDGMHDKVFVYKRQIDFWLKTGDNDDADEERG